MFTTAFAILVTLLLGFYPPTAQYFDPYFFSILMLTGGILILLGSLLLSGFALGPLEQLEQKLIPQLMELIRKDQLLQWGKKYLFLFPLLSFVCIALDTLIENLNLKREVFLVWIVLFGLALDILRDSWNRYAHFLNPSYLVNQLSRAATKAIQNDEDENLWSALDSLAEVGLRSVENSKLALATQSLRTFPSLIQTFFASSKSIGHISHDQTVEQETGRDEASYTLFYLLQRIELIYDKALEKRLETICRQIITMMGKIIVYSAEYDLSMMTYPTHFLTKFGLKAQHYHLEDVMTLATSTLIEVMKTILSKVDLKYAELQEPFGAVIHGLETFAKGVFKKNKNSQIKLLIQPLQDLKTQFQSEKIAGLRDTPGLIGEINRILEEFSILEQVMQTIPPISDIDGLQNKS